MNELEFKFSDNFCPQKPDDEDEVLDVIDNVEATTVHAALSNPLRRDRTAALLKASSGQDAVFQILSGQRSLV
jgi:hypothetical protein